MIGRDSFTGPLPSLIAEDVERLIRAMDARPPRFAGYTRGTEEIMRGFSISRRTLYRYWPGRVEWVEVDGYRIPFLLRPGLPPVVLESRAGRGKLVDKLV